MISTHSARIVIALCLGALLVVPVLADAQAPPISGMVVKDNGDILSQATVELLAPGSERVVHQVYTDTRGRFAVRQVDDGPYDLRIRYGSQVLTQKTDGGSVERRRIVLNGAPQQLTIRLG